MRAASIAAALGTFLVIFALHASAQYMYLDSNGDGVNTAEDRVNGAGPTHVTVWLDIAHDRNGNSVTCNSHTGAPSGGQTLDIFEYSVTLDVPNGSGSKVNWGTFADSLGFFPLGTDLSTDSTYFFERTILTGGRPPGRYKLGSFDLTVAAGSPAIRISTGVILPRQGPSYTIFGSHCPATDNPNSYTLGIDWFDADGLGAPTTVETPYAARVFSTNSEDTFRLHSGKPGLCVQIEPVDSDYRNEDVDLSTLTMVSLGTGTVARIFATGSKIDITADRDRNGIQEITSCFARADLENLFSQINGRKDVPVALEGRLTSGHTLRGTTTLSVIGNKASLHAVVSPNPLNPGATLRFVTEAAGPLRVRVFDVAGRMIREVVNQVLAPAGEQSVRVDGSGMPSGVYLYRIDSSKQTATGRFAILK